MRGHHLIDGQPTAHVEKSRANGTAQEQYAS
jgi:hypothetical protein